MWVNGPPKSPGLFVIEWWNPEPGGLDVIVVTLNDGWHGTVCNYDSKFFTEENRTPLDKWSIKRHFKIEKTPYQEDFVGNVVPIYSDDFDFRGYRKRKSILVYGGSFNPPTLAHYEIGKICSRDFIVKNDWFSEFWYMPCWEHPFAKDLIPGKQRVEMLEMLVADIPEAKVCKFQIERQQKLSTIQTIELFQEYNDYEYTVVVGYDCLLEIEKWDRWEELVSKYCFVAFYRDGYEGKIPEDKFRDLRIFKVEGKGSSTDVRTAIQTKNYGEAASYLDGRVLKYILQNNLYGTDT